MAISGIPSMVNEFSAGSFMTTHYHSQYDSDVYYNEAAYRFHHELYGLLLMHLDRQSVAPLNFAEVFEQASASLDVLMCQKSGSRVTALLNLLGQTEAVSYTHLRAQKRWQKKFMTVFMISMRLEWILSNAVRLRTFC